MKLMFSLFFRSDALSMMSKTETINLKLLQVSILQSSSLRTIKSPSYISFTELYEGENREDNPKDSSKTVYYSCCEN